MELNKVFVLVDGIGNVEVREMDYAEAEPLFDLPPEKLGKALIKGCLFLDGKRIFDGPVGMSVANKLFELSQTVMEVNGLGKQKDH